MSELTVVRRDGRIENKRTIETADKKGKRVLPALVLWAVFLMVLALAFEGQKALAEFYPAASVRFEKPVNAASALAARRYAVEKGGEEGLWPTFWSESAGTLNSELFSAEAKLLYYAGQGNLVMPQRFLSGGWPGATDEEGCVVSEQLAWGLWGGFDVVGKTVHVDGRDYVVRGVFAGDEELALLAAEADDYAPGWQAAEFAGSAEELTKADVETFLTGAGLGEASAILVGWWAPFLARGLLFLPLVMFGAWCLFGVLRGWKREQALSRMLVVIGLLLVGALVLPAALEGLPGRLLPGQWSDFSFWTSLWQDAVAGAETFLSMGSFRDLAGRKLVMQQVLVSGLLLLLTVLLLWNLSKWVPAEREDKKCTPEKKR